MVSYVVCLWHANVARYMAIPSLLRQKHLYGAEIIGVRHPTSIFKAYEQGRKRANHRTIVYLHEDIALLDFDATPRILEQLDASGAALMGVAGARPGEGQPCRVPWEFNTDKVGGWAYVSCNSWDEDKRGCRLVWNWGENGEFKAAPYTGQRPVVSPERVNLLDGIFLADRSGLPWTDHVGWHGYDADRCMCVKAAGGKVAVGDIAVAHHAQPHSEEWTRAVDTTCAWLREKWGLAFREG